MAQETLLQTLQRQNREHQYKVQREKDQTLQNAKDLVPLRFKSIVDSLLERSKNGLSFVEVEYNNDNLITLVLDELFDKLKAEGLLVKNVECDVRRGSFHEYTTFEVWYPTE